jgi:lysozyme family protein
MAEFTQDIYDDLLEYEGGYTNDEHDSGGRTVYGITEHYDKAFFDVIHPLFLAEEYEEAKAAAKYFYYNKYWLGSGANKIDSVPIATQIFDICVNMGFSRRKLLQLAYNDVSDGEKLVVDGIFGEKTIAAVNGYPNDERLNNKLVERRIEKYHDIVARNPALGKFIKGWTRRAKGFII